MTTKCTGVMGRIFGHKWIDCNSWSRKDKEYIYLNLPDKYRFPYVFKGCICQRCGAVTGEKK